MYKTKHQQHSEIIIGYFRVEFYLCVTRTLIIVMEIKLIFNKII